MKAVILAGGEGTRLRPLTASQPKPMLPMVNVPMAEHVVTLLRRHGFDEIVVTVGFLASTIRNYFGDGSELGVRLVYATEEVPLGTAGSVLNARAELDDRFLVISGDVLTDVDLTALVEFHTAQGAAATLALQAVENPLEFGMVIIGPDGRVERFLEKPGWGDVFSDTINTGIYVLEPEVLDWIPEGRAVDFSTEVFPMMLEADRPLFGHVSGRYWEDVGTLEAYLRAHADILDGKVDIEVPGFPFRPKVWLGAGAEIHPSAKVEGPALIGDNCRIGPGVELKGHCVLGANVRVGEDTVIERCVVHDNVYIASAVRARGAVIARSCDVRQGVHLEDGVVLGEGARAGRQSVVGAGVKVYPHKIIEPGAVVNSSIIWESRGSRRIFGRYGVGGIANVDLSPEVAVRVALAYATTLPKGATVAVSRDSSRAARMLKRAAMVGIIAAGCNVEDLEVATVPVTRFLTRTGTSVGGMTVRLVPGDPQSVVLRFFNEDGMDVDEATQRKIERLYNREESRRVLAAEIGDIDFATRTVELYTNELTSMVDLDAIRAARFKLVLDYAFGTASFVMPNVLAKLGADVLGINPNISTSGVIGFDRAVHARRLSDLVQSSGANLGAIFDPDGEQLTLVDDTGHVLEDDEALLTLVQLVSSSEPGSVIAVPVDASHQVEGICAANGAEVLWTKLSASLLVEAADSPEVHFAANTFGGFVFPQFLPAFDAIAVFVRLLSLLASRREILSHVVSRLPTTHIVRWDVPTPFEQKGLVMRTLLEHADPDRLVLLDGMKTFDPEGWTLVVPDPDTPLTRIFAEAKTRAGAKRRAEHAADDIEQILAQGTS
ncbi:MAG: sugar phosphate nucleotidyltransferase [Acidimicrobiales bacterium]